jgi:hypothetical protein
MATNYVTTLCDAMRWDQLTTSDSPANYKTKSKLPKSTNYNYETPNNYLNSSTRSLRYLYIGWFFTPPFELARFNSKQIQSIGLDLSLAIADRAFCKHHLLRFLRCPASRTVILRSCRSHNQQGSSLGLANLTTISASNASPFTSSNQNRAVLLTVVHLSAKTPKILQGLSYFHLLQALTRYKI